MDKEIAKLKLFWRILIIYLFVFSLFTYIENKQQDAMIFNNLRLIEINAQDLNSTLQIQNTIEENIIIINKAIIELLK